MTTPRRIDYAGSVHDEREIDAVVAVLRGGPQALRIGKNVRAFERGIAALFAKRRGVMCNSGSSALYLAKRFIEGGLADCTLALGFEKMEKGSLGIKYMDRAMPMQRTFEAMNDKRGFTQAPPAPQMFGNAGREFVGRFDAPVVGRMFLRELEEFMGSRADSAKRAAR